jgi:hypothetical protein
MPAIAQGDFVFPDEIAEEIGEWDPNIGLGPIGFQKEPLANSDVRRDVAVMLQEFGCESEEDYWVKPVKYIASEVGDDEVVVSNNPVFVGLLPVVHKMLGMKTSREDTSISRRFGNFCEELLILPDQFQQTYHAVRNSGKNEELAFLDVPKLRLGINIHPMRMDHSSTNDGKYSMEASRLAWLNGTFSRSRIIHEIFSLFQDVSLGFVRDKKFAYLPTALGGYGKPPAFQNPLNLERAMCSWKQGTHAGLIRAIIRRTNVYIQKTLDDPLFATRDKLLNHVSRFQSSFHDWVKGRTIHAPTTWIDIPPELADYQVAKLGQSTVKDDVICRLMTERRLVTESHLQVVVEHNELCRALTGSANIREFQRIREEALRKWRGLSVFSRESYGMIEEITIDPSEMRPLKPHEVSSFMRTMRSRNNNLLKMVLRSEPVYDKAAIDAVYTIGPMLVPIDITPRNKIGGMQLAVQKPMLGTSTDDNQSMEPLFEWLKSGGKGGPPSILDTGGGFKLRYINDDEAIIVEMYDCSQAVIVTDDKKLCRRANAITKRPVIRVPVEWWYRSTYFGEGDKPWLKILKEETSLSFTEFVDSGSVRSGEELLFFNGSMMESISCPFNWTKGLREKDQTQFEESMNFSDERPPGWGSKGEFLYDVAGAISKRHRINYARGSGPQLWRKP